ncbi:peptide/nickel transport system permease protein [Desulfotomaculum arcticum]|uniref:Nickel import system permease protein NikB n=1 Tax=Desulfotruncus arcticus DSM 17038 TaxID=1121424 RepID=A0A1I2XPX3_9FIRM|nr:nickel ABC transporter permease [Desulfotruncus arcticus]SFH15500.1 peptide/nickel transport system permease protein [Desulfotomaculum arcticum] [Desulfotruncus arcticus DSM 17038]
MQSLILRRFFVALLVMLTASLLSFTLLYFAPGNPAEAILRQRTGNDPNFEEIALFMENHELNKAYSSQCIQWMYMISRGDFGSSLKTGEPVLREFFGRFGATAQLAVAAMVISLLLALPLGVLAAVRQNSLPDHVTRVVALLGISIPEFWLGIMLMVLFSLILGWLPCFGSGTVKHFVLPVVTLGTGIAAALARLTRAAMLEVLPLDYIKTARAKGLREPVIIWKHALKNALIPVLTAFGSQLGHLMAGAVVVETVFSWPGIGKFLVDSIYARDYPVIQGFVFLVAAVFVLVNLLVDIAYYFLDPRVRFEKGWR